MTITSSDGGFVKELLSDFKMEHQPQHPKSQTQIGHLEQEKVRVLNQDRTVGEYPKKRTLS